MKPLLVHEAPDEQDELVVGGGEPGAQAPQVVGERLGLGEVDPVAQRGDRRAGTPSTAAT